MGSDRDRRVTFYADYLQRCNEHRFAELEEFVAPEVKVNGAESDLPRYSAGLAGVIALLPDFHWELQHLLVDGAWLAAHLIDTGTTRTGRAITVREFAVYRVVDERIVDVWGDLEPSRLQ